MLPSAFPVDEGGMSGGVEAHNEVGPRFVRKRADRSEPVTRYASWALTVRDENTGMPGRPR